MLSVIDRSVIFGRLCVTISTNRKRARLFKNILVATDGSDLAAKAVEQGILLAKAVGAKITAATVTEPFNVLSLAPSELGYTPFEYKKHAEAYAGEVLGTVLAAATSAGVACETLHVEHEHVYQEIIDAASARRCDLIVMASHGRRGVSFVGMSAALYHRQYRAVGDIGRGGYYQVDQLAAPDLIRSQPARAGLALRD